MTQEWDNELADLSQFYSALCEGMPNEDRHDQSTDPDFVGENLAATTNYSANLNFTAIVAGWFENKKFFNYYTLTCTDADGNEDDEGEGCTRYTQVRHRHLQLHAEYCLKRLFGIVN